MTSRRFYILLALFTISIKVQKLPCFMYYNLGKDSYLMILFYFLVNIAGILMAMFILKRKDKIKQIFESKKLAIQTIKRIVLFLTSVYFVFQALLLYEHIQDLFSNTLFDNMPWWVFSLLLLFTVFYLSHTGIKNIALGGELYVPIIFICYIVIAVLGGAHSDFSSVLPFETISINALCDNFVKFNAWFGDFFIILFLGFNAKDFKTSKTLIIYSASVLFVAFLVVCFNGIYLNNASLQAGMISVLTERAMLGLNVGRIDWFVILITEIGVVISCGMVMFFACQCMRQALPKIKSIYIEIALAAVVYYFDIFYLVDLHEKIQFFYGFVSYFCIALKISFLIVLFAIALFIKSGQKKDIIKDQQKKVEYEKFI